MANFLKKIFKHVTKVFKKVISSKLFKVALIAAAIYTGGAALGAWGGGAGAGTAAAAGTTAAGTTAGATAGEVAAANMSLVGGGEAVGGMGTAGGLTATEQAVLDAGAKKGIIGNVIKGIGDAAGKVGGFVEKHPMASAMGANAIASATSQDEEDLLKEQERIRRSRYQNMQVPGSVGIESSGQPLYYVDGRPVYNPQGIINQGMKS
jgi:hypothetical protein